MLELKYILEGNFNTDILTNEVKEEICNKMVGEGYSTYTNCLNFDNIKETNHILLENKLIILTKIPIRSSMDVFRLYQFISLPIKHKDHFVKANINKFNYFAIGSVYRTNIDYNDCTQIQSIFFCKPKDAFVNLKEDNSCIGSIIHNSDNIFENCEFNIVKMNNVFVLLDETYYYSIHGELSFEVICLDSLLNDRIVLLGLGSIKLKLGCYAKSNDVLLAGNNRYNLNGSYYIDNRDLLESQWDLVNITKMNNILPNELPGSNPKHESNTDVKNHLITIYTTLVLFATFLFIFIILKFCKFICLVRKNIKVDSVKHNEKIKDKKSKTNDNHNIIE